MGAGRCIALRCKGGGRVGREGVAIVMYTCFLGLGVLSRINTACFRP